MCFCLRAFTLTGPSFWNALSQRAEISGEILAPDLTKAYSQVWPHQRGHLSSAHQTHFVYGPLCPYTPSVLFTAHFWNSTAWPFITAFPPLELNSTKSGTSICLFHLLLYIQPVAHVLTSTRFSLSHTHTNISRT